MKILFMTIGGMHDIEEHDIYTDLLRCFRDKGHDDIYVVTHHQKRENLETELHDDHGIHMLGVKIGNITKCGMIEKGISTLTLKNKYMNAIKKYFCNIKFDLIMYSTPPITLAEVIEYVKKRDNAKTYLLLKDIFPQNAVDLGMMTTTGPKSIIYKMFRRKEKHLYALSDTIGCMSQANVDYVLKHNPEIPPEKVEICPNSIEPIDMRVSEEEKKEIRKKYNLPLDKKIFVYGGNFGRPQDVPFIVECLKACADIKDAYFVIAGSGTDRHFLEEYIEAEKPSYVRLFGFIPKAEYDKMIACCDVGMIFLDHRFTIPNFPSRLLSYMQAGLPVLACTDANTDIGKVITEGGFGWWCESDSTDDFVKRVQDACSADRSVMGKNASKYLEEKYTVKTGYQTIASHLPHSDAETTVIERREI